MGMRVLAGVDLNTATHQWLCEQAVVLAGRLQAPLDLCFVTQETADAKRMLALFERKIHSTRGQ